MEELKKAVKPSDTASVKAGEITDTIVEYERYLQLHEEFAVDNGSRKRGLLRKRMVPIVRALKQQLINSRSRSSPPTNPQLPLPDVFS